MKNKVPPAVAAAKAVLAEKTAELDAAQEVVKRIESERSQAFKAIRKAQEDADESLPQCKMTTMAYGKPRNDPARVVILRKTPTGMLVVRYFGDSEGSEYTFKRSPHDERFTENSKRAFYHDYRVLSDVPAEYMAK